MSVLSWLPFTLLSNNDGQVDNESDEVMLL